MPSDKPKKNGNHAKSPQDINDPSLRRIGSTSGITRFGKGFHEQLKAVIEANTKFVLDHVKTVAEYGKVITITAQQIVTALEGMGEHVAVSLKENNPAFRPFNTRSSKKKDEEQPPKKKTKAGSNQQNIQKKNKHCLLIPKKSFDKYCRDHLKKIVNNKGETTEPRWEASAIPVLQFFIEKRAIALCNKAHALARYSGKETVFGSDIEFASHDFYLRVA